ncbi:MAG: hypothetical protein ACR2O3_18135, partial [Rhizobiaceae bacterium]
VYSGKIDAQIGPGTKRALKTYKNNNTPQQIRAPTRVSVKPSKSEPPDLDDELGDLDDIDSLD